MIQRLGPDLLATMTALVDGLERAGVRYCLIGALVPELLLKTPPPRRTNDVDAVVLVETLAAFDRVKGVLAEDGFSPTLLPYRLQRGTGRIDLRPYGKTLAADGTLRLAPNIVLNMLGFDRVLESQTRVDIAPGRSVPIVTIPLYALLKIVAYSDRREARDPAGVLHCLLHYEEDAERLYGVEHDGSLVRLDLAPAYLLGLDGRPLVDEPLARVVRPIVTDLCDAESTMGFRTVREYRGFSDERLRVHAAQLFTAYRDGLGLAPGVRS